jgi:hypothetical protein
MIGFLILLLHVLISPFKTQARLEAEIVLLRHQLSVLRQRVPSKPRLTVADRLLFVWLYRLFPSVWLALLAPEIVETILEGRQPVEMSLVALMRPFPINWDEQRGRTGHRSDQSGL